MCGYDGERAAGERRRAPVHMKRGTDPRTAGRLPLVRLFIGAGLGTTYDGERGTQAGGADNPRFTHAFRLGHGLRPLHAYGKLGRTARCHAWKSGASQTEGSINRAGRFATQLYASSKLRSKTSALSRTVGRWVAFALGDRLAPVAKPLAGVDAALLRRVFIPRTSRWSARSCSSIRTCSKSRREKRAPSSRGTELPIRRYADSRMMLPTAVDEAGT